MRTRRRVGALVLFGWIGAIGTAHALTITEIHYHPRPADGRTEFVEVLHDGSTPLDLGGFGFVEGIRYAFPAGTVVEPGQYLVVARDPAEIRRAYGVDAFGPYEGRLDNDGERITLAREGGGRILSIRYRDGDGWPEEADGFGHSLALRAPYLDPREASSWAASPEIGGSPGRANGLAAEAFDTDLVPPGAAWRYLAGAAAPPADWRDPDFDDAAWPAGPSGFGYGDGDDATVLEEMRGGHVAVFLRRAFELPSTPPDTLILRVRYDDAFAAWIDGVPAARAGLGPDPIAFDARAERSHEAQGFEPFDLAGVLPLLAPGRHVLAVEGHNVSISSSDFSLEPVLVAREIAPEGGPPRELVLNEVLLDPAEDGWIEIHNRGDGPLDLGGASISGMRDDPERYRVPEGTVVPARGFLVIGERDLGFPLWPEDGEFAVFLQDAAGRRVLDAHTIQGPPDRAPSFGRLRDGGDRWGVLAEATPGGPNRAEPETAIVINEIMYHPLGDDDPLDPEDPEPEDLEYVELYNRGNRGVDLEGWRFDRGILYTFPAMEVGTGEYLVVARDPERLRAVYGTDDVVGPFAGQLADDGELVRLLDARGNVADEVRYRDGGEWDEWADGLGSSLERVDPRADNASASAWRASDESRRAPWARVEYASSRLGEESEIQIWLLGKGTVLLDDLRVVSGGTEYLAGGDFESGIARWAFRGTHQDSALTTEDAVSGAHALRIEASGRGEQRWNYVEVDASRPFTSGRTYTISYWARWVRGLPVILTRQHGHGLARTVHLEVPEALGTPGRRNSRFRPNAGPNLDGLVQSPVLPLASQSVAVRIRAADPDGVASVRLLYRDQAAGAFASVSLEDDGAHGDGRPDDGTYGGAIPPFPSRARVVFRIEAEDALGEPSVFPRRGPGLYIVDDGRPKGDVTACQLVMTDETFGELAARPIMSNHLLPASFVLGDEAIYHNVGFRYRGSPYIRPHQPAGHRIRFPNDHPFRGRVTHMNLDSQLQDPTRQHERAVFHILRKLGVARDDAWMPYSLQDYVILRRNGIRLGLYEQVERVDDEYVRAWWPEDDDGYLLKVNVQTEFRDDGGFALRELASLAYRGEDEEAYRLLFNMFSHEERDDFGPIIDLCRTIARTSGRDLERAMDGRAWMRQWADQIAARLYVADWDTFGVRNGHNIYLYYAPLGARWAIIPWDADLTFGDASATTDIGPSFPALRKIFARPVFARMLRSAYRRLIDDVADPAAIGPDLDRVHAVIGREGAASPAPITSFLAARAAVVRGRLPDPAFRITTHGGEDFEADAFRVSIRGTASVAVERMTLNGEPVDDALQWTGVTSWRIEVLLEPGENPLAFGGFDHRGALVGEAAITVRAPVPPPHIERVVPDEGPAAGGTRVSIQGSGFQPGAQVYFAGVGALDIAPISPAEIAATTPPSPVGPFLVEVTVTNPDRRSDVLLGAFRYVAGAAFIRADANGDGAVDLADAIRILTHLFAGAAIDCRDAADANDDGRLDLGDAIGVLTYLYAGGSPPAVPFPEAGLDPTPDDLGCDRPASGP